MKVVERISAIVGEFEEVKHRARALGIFTDDRELLACPVCDLLEDVTIMGLLITYSKDSPQQNDSGLRFMEIDGTRFICPSCGTTITLEEEIGREIETVEIRDCIQVDTHFEPLSYPSSGLRPPSPNGRRNKILPSPTGRGWRTAPGEGGGESSCLQSGITDTKEMMRPGDVL